jgi:hypothetical protein
LNSNSVASWDIPLTIQMNGTGVDYTRALSVNPPQNTTPYKIDSYISRKVVLNPGSDLALSFVTGFIVNIKYDGDFLNITYDPYNPDTKAVDVEKDGVILGGLFDPTKYTYKIIPPREVGALTVEIDRAPGNTGYLSFPAGGDLLTLTMGIYLPKGNSRLSNFDVNVSAVQDSGSCVAIVPTTGTILIDSTCVFDIRKINFTNGTFNLSAIKPNPVTGGEAIISFDIANLDCPTRIEIYNSANQLVAVPIDKVMQPGRYEVSVPVETWSSGSYYYIMRAGPYEEQQRMVIVK